MRNIIGMMPQSFYVLARAERPQLQVLFYCASYIENVMYEPFNTLKP